MEINPVLSDGFPLSECGIDDVIKVSGYRLGTAEVESALPVPRLKFSTNRPQTGAHTK